MNKFFRKLPLHVKLVLIGTIPFCFLLYLTIQVYRDKTEKLKLIDNYKSYMAESANINGLIDALQEERKFSFDYAMTKSMRQELVLQRPRTSALLNKILTSNDPSITGITGYTKLGELEEVRGKVDSFKIKPEQVMHFYSNTVFRLNTLNTLPPANTPYLKPVYDDLVTQKILSEMITYMGIIRSNIYNVLHSRQYMIETLIGTIGTHDIYLSYESELLAKAPPAMASAYKELKKSTALKPTSEYIEKLFSTFAFDSSYTAAEWWKVSDVGVDELREFQGKIWTGLNEKVSKIYQDEQASRSKTFILLIAALISVIVIVTYISLVIGRTLKQLQRAAEKIAKGENHSKIPIDSNDAIGSLAKSISNINSNHQALAMAAAEIGKGNFDVSIAPRGDADVLVTAIIRMKDELQQYSRKMESLVAERTVELMRSNEDLQQFAHVASHDLKEPLRKISTFSNILSSTYSDELPDKAKLYLQKIEHASHRMSDMIEGVLAYSTITVNEPNFETVDLNKIIEGVKSDLELALIQKEGEVKSSKLSAVTGIPLLLHQLFYNIINNSLKFSKANVPPVIKISADMFEHTVPDTRFESLLPGKYIRISVTDNGIGFNKAYTSRMFGVFFRLHTKDKYEGTGLGLALCRKIALRHKGDIYAEAEEDKGATFHVLLPHV